MRFHALSTGPEFLFNLAQVLGDFTELVSEPFVLHVIFPYHECTYPGVSVPVILYMLPTPRPPATAAALLDIVIVMSPLTRIMLLF